MGDVWGLCQYKINEKLESFSRSQGWLVLLVMIFQRINFPESRPLRNNLGYLTGSGTTRPAATENIHGEHPALPGPQRES